MTNWTLHPALIQLRDQINQRWPNRSKKSDGTIGDTAHSSRASDHNPDERGVVHAMDVTHDPSGCDASKLAEVLRLSKDSRLKYCIFAGRIFSSTVQPWTWRPYSGSNPHNKHVHVSVGGDQVPWTIE